MTEERHARLTTAFLATFRLDASGREEAVSRLAETDPELAPEVLELLACHDDPAGAGMPSTPAIAPPLVVAAPPEPERVEPEPAAAKPVAAKPVEPAPGTAGGESQPAEVDHGGDEMPKRPVLMSILPGPVAAEPVAAAPVSISTPAADAGSATTEAADLARPSSGHETAGPRVSSVFAPVSAEETPPRAPGGRPQMRYPGHRSLFWPLSAAAALVVAVAGWTVPLITLPAATTSKVAAEPAASPDRPEAELVSEFLADVLAEPDPAAAGREASMIAWLDRCAQQLGSRLAARPQVKATLHGTLGRAYNGLRLHPQAELQFRAMLELRRTELGPTHRATLDAVALVGCALLEQGRRLDEAEQFLRDALRDRLAQLGARDPDTLASRVHLARLHAKRAEVEEAERVYDDVLKVMRSELGPDHPVTLEGMERYALFLLGLNRTAEAALRVEEIHKRYRKRYGPDHPRTVAMLNALATTYSRRGDDQKAEAAFKDLLRIHLEQHGKEHQKTLFARLNLGIVLEKRKNFAAAEVQFRHAVEIHRESGVLDPPVLVTAATRWARVLVQLGRLEQAAAEFERIDALVTRLYGAGDRRLHHFRTERGELLSALGRFPAAEKVLLKNYRWLKQRPGDELPQRDDYLAPLARLYEKWGKERQAGRVRDEIRQRRAAHR